MLEEFQEQIETGSHEEIGSRRLGEALKEAMERGEGELERILTQGKKISRRDFLKIAAMPLVALSPKEKEVLGGKKEERKLSWIQTVIPLFLGYVNQPGLSEQERRRRVLKALGGIVALSLLGGIVHVSLTRGERIEKRTEKQLRKGWEWWRLPKEERKRRQLQQEALSDPAYQEFKEGISLISPFDINSAFVAKFTAKIGPTWMFVPKRQDDLEKWFGRKFTLEEIEEYRANPAKFIQLLENLEAEGKIEPEVVEFYQKSPEQIWREAFGRKLPQ